MTKRFKVYMERTVTESFIIDADDVNLAVERARYVMEQGRKGTFEKETIEDGLYFEEIHEDESL